MVTRRLRENSPRTHSRLVEFPAFIAFAILGLTSRRSASKKGGTSDIAIFSKSVSYYAQIVSVVQYGRPARSTAVDFRNARLRFDKALFSYRLILVIA
jgi:hypothetical protein